MKQIFSWTVGSFFRTIGRIAAFMIIGFVIAKLVDFSGLIDSFKITDLFFEKVNASGIAGYGYFASAYKSDGTQLANGSMFADGIRVNILEKDKHILFNDQGQLNGNGISISYQKQYKQVVFQIGLFSNSSVAQVITSGAAYARFARNGSFYASTICQFVGDLNADFDQDDITSQTAGVYYNLVCPIPEFYDSNIMLTRLTISTASGTTNEFFEINRNVTYLLNDNYILQQGQQGITNAINNQTQQQHEDAQAEMNQTQQNHNELMDTNSSQTDETSSSFFGNFTTEDQGGLSSIVTAPLSMINELLNGQCTQPSATWKGATISLPCGDMFWNRNGANALKDLLNVFYGGFICYYAIRKLFLMIESFKDPTNDRIEVSDL